MPNITGSISTGRTGYANNTKFMYDSQQGAFHTDDSNGGGGNGGDWLSSIPHGGQLKFDASLSNTLYGASDTVQPPAMVLIPQIKYI